MNTPVEDDTATSSTEVIPPVPPAFDIYSVQFPPWWCFNFFLMIWCLGSVVEYLLPRCSVMRIGPKFKALEWDKKRNVVVYILQTILTTLALALQIIGSIDVVFQRKDSTTEWQYSFLIVTANLVFVLYVWELIFRLRIGWPLLIHHIMTCLMIQLLSASLMDTFDIEYARLAILLTFYATTEQTSFIALFCYRLDLCSKKTQHQLFTAAAIQSLVVKSIIAIFSLVYFIVIFFVRKEADDQQTNWKWFWKISFIPLVLMLFGAQLYTSQILWQLRNKCFNNQTTNNDDERVMMMAKVDCTERSSPTTKNEDESTTLSYSRVPDIIEVHC